MSNQNCCFGDVKKLSGDYHIEGVSHVSYAWTQHLDENYTEDTLVSPFREKIDEHLNQTSTNRSLVIIGDQILHPLKYLVDKQVKEIKSALSKIDYALFIKSAIIDPFKTSLLKYLVETLNKNPDLELMFLASGYKVIKQPYFTHYCRYIDEYNLQMKRTVWSVGQYMWLFGLARYFNFFGPYFTDLWNFTRSEGAKKH